MNCMKCGREIPANQVFCAQCLSVMEQYPVKPDIAIQLPRKREENAAKKSNNRKRQLSPEEQALHWRKKYRRALACLLIAVLLLGAAAAAILKLIPGDQVALPPIGRNYTIDPQG